MTRLFVSLSLVVPIAACSGDEGDSNRDADGCWLDGHEAWSAMSELMCSPDCSTTASDDAVQDCLDYYSEVEARKREMSCFDGCNVDACLAGWEAWLGSCSDEDGALVGEACFTGENAVFYDNKSETRECWPEDQGW